MTTFSSVLVGYLPDMHCAASPGCTRRAHTKPVVGNASSGYRLVTTSALCALHCGVMVKLGSACPPLSQHGAYCDLNHRRVNRVTAPRKPRPSRSQTVWGGYPAKSPLVGGCDRHAATSLVISRRSAPDTQVLLHNLGLGRSKSKANGPPLAPAAKPGLSSGHRVPLELMHTVRSGGIGFYPIRQDGLAVRSTAQQSPTLGMVDPSSRRPAR